MKAVAGCLYRFLAACLLLAVVAVTLLAWPRADPADAPPRPIRIAIGMTVRDFIAGNGLSIGERERHGFAIQADVTGDTSPIILDDHWIALTAVDGAQSFDLPPGRTLHVTQIAGRIESFAFRPFAFPRPLEEVSAYADELIARLQADGWRPRFPPDTPRTKADFDRNGKALFGEHVSRNGSVLQMNIRDYGLAPRSESWILNPLAPRRAETRTYLLQVTLGGKGSGGYGDLIYPRRLFVNGDKKKALPLRVWIEDPAWTPAAAGMVWVPPEDRPGYDRSHWRMPDR